MNLLLDVIILIFSYIGFVGIGMVIGVLISQKYLKNSKFDFFGGLNENN